jgi:hypothetical protein
MAVGKKGASPKEKEAKTSEAINKTTTAPASGDP